MDPEQELAAAIADRAHWRREGRAAIYGPGTPATVRVLPIAQPSRRERFAAVILRGGRAKHTLPCDTAKQAVLLYPTGCCCHGVVAHRGESRPWTRPRLAG